jgi:hypothetical protein
LRGTSEIEKRGRGEYFVIINDLEASGISYITDPVDIRTFPFLAPSVEIRSEIDNKNI